MPLILKMAMKVLLGNGSLQIKLFLWLADLLVKQTDNEFDDQLVELLRETLGQSDQEGDEMRVIAKEEFAVPRRAD